MAKNEAGSATEIEKADYNAIVDTAELVDVKLIKSEFDIHPEFFIEESAHDHLRYSCVEKTTSYMAEAESLIGIFSFEAGCKKSRRWLLHSKCNYLVVYTVSGYPSESAAREYVRRVGKMACYPYFRAHFASVCASAGAEMPPLPVMRGNSLPRKIVGGSAAAIDQKDH